MFNGVKTILTMSIYHKDLSFTQVLRGEEGKEFLSLFSLCLPNLCYRPSAVLSMFFTLQ
jgi:hypothetical protein